MQSYCRCLLLALLPFWTQCLTPAASRAKRDETVGRATTQSYDVRTGGGLAVVRSASSERLALWQNAPTITFTLDVHEAVPLQLHIDNTIPGSRLRLLNGEASVVSEGPNQTKQRSWRIGPLHTGALEFRLDAPHTDTEPFRFALMSDVQEAIDDVDDIYRVINRIPNLDFLLGAGDLTQRGEREQLEQFERQLQELALPYYTTLGNHELGQEPTLFHDFYGRGSFSFVHRGARFTLIDSASATIDQKTYGWLREWLKLGANQFHVLAMHIPPVDPTGTRNGAFASRDEALALFAELQEYDVDLTLYGHIHSFYDFDNAGIPAVISGGGGAIPERFDGVGRHFVVFDVDPVHQSFGQELVSIE
jgi:3',5'-cyclic-AMP phosphodiesterase